MNHVVLSSRAQLIYEFVIATLPEQDRSPVGPESSGCDYSMPFGHLMEDSPNFQTPKADDLVRVKPLRQQTLADEFDCSRRTIGRCLTELKAAGLLSDTGKRENRVKVYAIDREKSPPFGKGRLGGILPETDCLSGIQIPPDPPFSKGGDSSSSVPRYITLEPFYSEGSKAQDHVPLTLTLSHKGRGDLPSEQPRYITLEPFYNQEFPPIRLMPGETLNPKAADQWRFYYKNIRLNLWCYDGQNGRPKLEDIYASLTQNLDGKDDMEVFKNMFQLLKGAPYYEACLESHERERRGLSGQTNEEPAIPRPSFDVLTHVSF